MEERNARVVPDVSDGSVAMSEHAVVIAGGGPAGMMLAAELALAKVDVAVVERSSRSRARRLTGRRSSLAHDRGAGSAWGR